MGTRRAVGCQRNVAVMGIAATNGHPISFRTFPKYELVVAPPHRRLMGYVALQDSVLA